MDIYLVIMVEYTIMERKDNFLKNFNSMFFSQRPRLRADWYLNVYILLKLVTIIIEEKTISKGQFEMLQRVFEHTPLL